MFRQVAGMFGPGVAARFGGMPYTWDPRAPVGVYAFKGWVAVRNLLLEPLPEP
jgi:hypothetical protein